MGEEEAVENDFRGVRIGVFGGDDDEKSKEGFAPRPHEGGGAEKVFEMRSFCLPETAPVMVLPGVPLLPFALLPMTVYEPRYRKMVRFALEGERMFCIALMKPGVENAARVSQFYQTGGIGLIRACVTRGDGAYNLVLQGLARVQMEGWCRVRPFRVAKIVPLPSGRGASAEAVTLAARVLELCSELKLQGVEVPGPIERQLETINDPSALADIVSHTFVTDPFARQQLLEELSVTNRLRRLISRLEDELTE